MVKATSVDFVGYISSYQNEKQMPRKDSNPLGEPEGCLPVTGLLEWTTGFTQTAIKCFLNWNYFVFTYIHTCTQWRWGFCPSGRLGGEGCVAATNWGIVWCLCHWHWHPVVCPEDSECSAFNSWERKEEEVHSCSTGTPCILLPICSVIWCHGVGGSIQRFAVSQTGLSKPYS